MFTAALFTVTKRQKQLKCPSKDEWINKTGYTHNRVLFSLKKKEILTFGTTWINLEDITLSKTNQTDDKYYDSTQMSSQIQKTKAEWWLPRGQWRREGGLNGEWKLCLMGRRKVLQRDSCTTLWMYLM